MEDPSACISSLIACRLTLVEFRFVLCRLTMTCWSTAAARSGVVDVIQVENPVGLGSTAAVRLLVGVVDGMSVGIAVVAPMSNGSPPGRIMSAQSRWHCDGDSWEFLATKLRSL